MTRGAAVGNTISSCGKYNSLKFKISISGNELKRSINKLEPERGVEKTKINFRRRRGGGDEFASHAKGHTHSSSIGIFSSKDRLKKDDGSVLVDTVDVVVVVDVVVCQLTVTTKRRKNSMDDKTIVFAVVETP